jgi:AcrR family transcriptional regulator
MANWTRRSARKAENRDRLLAAASELFAENGYWRTSLDDVAKRAGLTKGAVYSSFESKEALLLAVAWNERIEVDASDLPDPSQELGQQMRRLGRMIARLAVSEELGAIAARELELSTLSLTSDHVRTALAEMGRRQRSGWAQLLEAFADRQGVDLPLPPAETAAILSALRTGLIRMRRLDPASIPPHFFEDAYELITTGSVSRPRKPRGRKPRPPRPPRAPRPPKRNNLPNSNAGR